MDRKKILTSIVITTSLIFLSINCFAEMPPGELAKASEAKAVATSSDPLTTGLIEKKVNEACELLGKKGEAAFPAFQLAFMRYLGHFAISVVQIGRGGMNWQRFASGHMGLVLLRAALLVASTVLNFIALNYLTLTVTSAIMFSAQAQPTRPWTRKSSALTSRLREFSLNSAPNRGRRRRAAAEA